MGSAALLAAGGAPVSGQEVGSQWRVHGTFLYTDSTLLEVDVSAGGATATRRLVDGLPFVGPESEVLGTTKAGRRRIAVNVFPEGIFAGSLAGRGSTQPVKMRMVVPPHKKPALGLEIDREGRRIAYVRASKNLSPQWSPLYIGDLVILDMDTGQEQVFKGPYYDFTLVWLERPERLLIAPYVPRRDDSEDAGDRFQVINLATGKVEATLDGYPFCAAYHPGAFLAAARRIEEGVVRYPVQRYSSRLVRGPRFGPAPEAYMHLYSGWFGLDLANKGLLYLADREYPTDLSSGALELSLWDFATSSHPRVMTKIPFKGFSGGSFIPAR